MNPKTNDARCTPAPSGCKLGSATGTCASSQTRTVSSTAVSGTTLILSTSCTSPAIPNAIAALLLHIRDRTHRIPDAYFGWTEGNPVVYMLRYLFLGEGDTAPVTREVLRKAVKKPLDRPRIHVG